MNARLPAYQPMLAAFHVAYADQLQKMISELPLTSGDHALDMACGDGAYTPWLAKAVSPGGCVTATDQSPAYLAAAKHRTRGFRDCKFRFIQGTIARLPFDDGSFDFIWCAQSLYSFENPRGALIELKRVLKPGGLMAVLEDDTMHQILFSWPVDIELMIRGAERRAFQKESDRPQKFYVGRRLRELFAEADLRPQRKRVYSSIWEAPFQTLQRRYLILYLKDLENRIKPYLTHSQRRQASDFIHPHGRRYLLNDPYTEVTCMDYIMLGKKAS